MKAILKPLAGKYYGTEIQITDEKGFVFEFRLWNNGTDEPSDRELENADISGLTISEWRENRTIWVGKPGSRESVKARDVIEITDSHFESRETHELAEKIVNLINIGTLNPTKSDHLEINILK